MFSRLVPAAHAAAIVAGVAHVATIAFVSGYVGLLGFGVIAMTYIFTFVAAVPFGLVLLTVIHLFRFGLIMSLVLFLVAAPLTVIALSTILFGFEPETIPLVYGFLAFPAVIAAWYYSVYNDWKKDHNEDKPDKRIA